MPCPLPVHLKKHVLLMTLIGDGSPAPKLKNVVWTSNEMMTDAFQQVQSIMVRMFRNCKLVHADLSEFNLLYSNSTVYVIDVAQAVDLSHPRSLEFLVRDVTNVLNFFDKIGAESLPTSHQLFTEITGIDMDAEKDLAAQAISYEEENRHANLRLFRAKPADYELSSMQSERCDETSYA